MRVPVPTMSIAIIRLSSLGDVLLVTPLVSLIKRTFPLAAIDVFVSKRFEEVWHSNPSIRHVFPVDTTQSFFGGKALARSAMVANNGLYDLVIDLQNNLRSWYVRLGIAHRVAIIDKHRLQKQKLVHTKKLTTPLAHIVERYVQTVPSDILPLDYTDISGLEFWLPSDCAAISITGSNQERTLGSTYPPEKQQQKKQLGRIALAPGAHHATKRWLPDRFAQLGAELAINYNSEVILLGAIAEYDLCSSIAHHQNAQSKIQNMAGAETLGETARLLDSCSLLVSNDTGVMHLAAARRVPVVAIFGSTVPELGFTPFGTPSRIIENTNIECRPCTHIGRSSCPKRHFECMNSVRVADVMRGVEQLANEIYDQSNHLL